MFRRNLSFLLFVIMLIGAFTAAPIAANAVSADAVSDTGAVTELAETGWSIPSETTFANRLAQLKEKYYPRGYSGAYYEDGHAMAWQCYGFACVMLNEVFGIKYYADGFVNKADYTWGQLYAGDIIRIRGNTHSIFVTKVTSKGYYICDANWDHANGVRWDAFYTIDEMKATFTYRIHVPGNTLKGTAAPKTGLYANAPKLRNTRCDASGVTVSWRASDEASSYRVYFKDDPQKSWKSVGVTDKTYFHYTAEMEYGKEYYFTVRALDCYGELISSYQKDGIAAKYIVAPPELKSVKAAVEKIKVSWDAVKGVNYYRLYTKADGDTNWHKVANVKGTSYSFTGGKAHTQYQFTVRCLNDKKALISGCSPKTLSTRFITYATQLTPPEKITAVPAKSHDTVKISWSSVKNGKRFQVFFRRRNDKNWKKLAVTANNYYFHTGLTNNTEYRYAVRCIDDKGAFISDCRAGEWMHFFRSPEKLIAEKLDDNGNIKVSWNAVKGAPAYTFYYMTEADEKWIRLETEAPITDNSFVFGGCENGVRYFFTVRVSDENGKLLSYYDANGVSLIYESIAAEHENDIVEPTASPVIPAEPAVDDPALTDSTSHCTELAAEPSLPQIE